MENYAQYLFIAGVVVGILILASYLIGVAALYRFFLVRNYQHKWMAFFPVANVYGLVEATYGTHESINLFGKDIPSIFIKFHPIILTVFGGICTQVPFIGGVIEILCSIAIYVIATIIYLKQFEIIQKPISIPFAIVCNLIPVVGHINLFIKCRGIANGKYDYSVD